ncbi:MAG: aspartyl/asparaginyl beta-hydroxylase domain-containing protein [Myxococcota bacterium]
MDRTDIAEGLWAELRRRFGPEGLGDIHLMLESWCGRRPRASEHPGQQYNELYVPGLPGGPWLAPDRLWFHPLVARSMEGLRAEAAQLVDGRVEPAMVNANFGPRGSSGTVTTAVGWERPSGWREWFFYRLNQRCEPARAGFPVSSAVADQIAAREWVASIGYQLLGPGVRLPPHTDVGNFLVTYQVGVRVPRGCGVRVDGQTRPWAPAEAHVFDNSYVHEAWNDGDGVRVLFSAYVLHPSLTAIQREALIYLASNFDFNQAPELINGGGALS